MVTNKKQQIKLTKGKPENVSLSEDQLAKRVCYPLDDQGIYCIKQIKHGGGGHLDPQRFSKWLHIKDQVLAYKQLWVN